MDTLSQSQSISIDKLHTELRFSVGGYWDTPSMQAFLQKLADAAAPFIQQRQNFNALGDLSDFVPQDRETAAAIRDSLMTAKKFGLRKFAVITSSALVKMQYRRITEGVEVAFFESKADALQWLRSA